jgi:hypothetical protein
MKLATLRARVTLWSVGVVTIALALLPLVQLELRQELIENLDKDIKAEAHDFFIALKQQRVDWQTGEASKRYSINQSDCAISRFATMPATCSIARRSSRKDRLLMPGTPKLQNIAWNGRALRFGVFHQDGIVLGIGGETKEFTETVAELLVAYIAVLPVVIVAVGFAPGGRAASGGASSSNRRASRNNFRVGSSPAASSTVIAG